MTAIRIVVLCVAAAMICTVLRTQRPEFAMVMSLTVGIASVLMTEQAFGAVSEGVKRFSEMALAGSEYSPLIFRAAGIVVISELGVQVCCDAGESALAGRIRLTTRVVMLGMAMPLVMDIMESVGSVLG